ncbi:hypothetical protein [Companilactobacillus sp. HBUAS59544]|uniref:hypothetical protein n=1 Tax=Companilactobacillus sp. HBUAS59544 TaxID=3109363 RepID=UPI002FF3D3E1
MNFLIMAIVFVLGIFFLMSGSHVKSTIISRIFYFIGTFSVLLAMYIAWPK